MAFVYRRWILILFITHSHLGCYSLISYAPCYTNTIEMKLILIPAGKFMMGSTISEEGRFTCEGPVHQVYLDAYYIGEKEVTVKQWKEFIKDTSYNWNKWSLLKKYAPGDDYPIVFVTWDDARSFCHWLSKKEGKTYRLPTEAEWEKAARGELPGKKYTWGDRMPDGTQCNFADINTDLPWSDKGVDDGYPYTAPVGSFPPNGYELYDMAGNAWEWCQDWFDWNYYKDSPTKNPRGPLSGMDRVMRGGSWCNDAIIIRCAFRGFILPNVPNHPRGFRLAMDP
jgi:formylglycine-generating enzyme required for sulfatase activity